jgi:copper chaperone CopZ
VSTHQYHVPGMSSRRCVREISGYVSDVPGVRTVEACLDTETVRVTGTAQAAAVQAAIRRAGYDATPMPERTPPSGAVDEDTTTVEVER